MPGLDKLWPFARTWPGGIAAVLSFLWPIFYAPKKVTETWRWYMYEFFGDRKVEDCLMASVTPEFPAMYGPKKWAIPKSLAEIAAETGYSESRLPGCLERLRRRGTVFAEGDKWKAKL